MDSSVFGKNHPSNDLSREITINLEKESDRLRHLKRIKVKFTAKEDTIQGLNLKSASQMSRVNIESSIGMHESVNSPANMKSLD